MKSTGATVARTERPARPHRESGGAGTGDERLETCEASRT